MRHVHGFRIEGSAVAHWPALLALAVRQAIKDAQRLGIDPTDATLYVERTATDASVGLIGEHVCRSQSNPTLN